MPVVTSLDELDEEALIRILKEPKNSIVRQYTALFEMDGVKLTFEEEALKKIAKETVARKTGARGLRAIMEKTVLDPMFTLPSDPTVSECIITPESVDGKASPKILHNRKPDERPARANPHSLLRKAE